MCGHYKSIHPSIHPSIHLQLCELFFAPSCFFACLFFAYLSHLNDSDYQTNFTLHKDNPSIYKMHFFYIMISFIKEKKLYKPAWPYVKKSNCSLNLITGCATLFSNNCNKAFAITGNETFTLLRNIGSLFFAELFYFSPIGGSSSMKGLFNIMPQHLNQI